MIFRSLCFGLFLLVLATTSISPALAEVNAKGAFAVTVKDRQVSVTADGASARQILNEIAAKSGISVEIFEGVQDRLVSVNVSAIPLYAIGSLLEQMGIKNYGIAFEPKSGKQYVYVVNAGTDMTELLRGKTVISREYFGRNKDITKVKGKEIVTTVDDKKKFSVSYIKDEILLKFHLGVTKPEIEAILKKHNLVAAANDGLAGIGYVKALIPDGRTVKDVSKAMAGEYKLKHPEPNYVQTILATTDPLYPDQWYVPEAGFDKAWEQTKSRGSVIVAVIDSGVQADHPDLKGRVLKGYDFVANKADAADDNGHGTFVSGIIAAAANDIGIRGLYDGARVLPVKVVDGNGVGTYEDAARGIIFAADNGARVINLSIGGYGFSYLLQDAVDYALEKGCIVVAAGGNDGIEKEIYPAAYPDVIGVAALGRNGQIWSGSNSGKHIDVSAPGADIVSTGLGGNYVVASGSSASAPMVSALAALLSVEEPDLSASFVQRLITQSAKDLGEKGWDKVYGNGEIDVMSSLAQKLGHFHDVAVRSITLESKSANHGKPFYVSANVENAGTYQSETCDVALHVVVGTEVSEVEVKKGVRLAGRSSITFAWLPDTEMQKVIFRISVISKLDEVPANNVKETKAYSLHDTGTLRVLYANNPPVHGWVALQAYNLTDGSLRSELAKFLPTNSDNKLYDSGFTVPSGWKDEKQDQVYETGSVFCSSTLPCTSLIEGAWEEDGEGLIIETRARNHFWNPDLDYNDGIAGFDSALKVAIKQRFANAITNYSNKNMAAAYYWLGRTAHLLMDMTVPEHVLKDPHTDKVGDGDSSYETYTAYNENYKSINSSGLTAVNVSDLPLSVPTSYISDLGNTGSDYADLVKLFYNTAQRTQFFDSDNKNGNGVDSNGQNIENKFGLTPDNGSKQKGTLHLDTSIESVNSVFWNVMFSPWDSRELIDGLDYNGQNFSVSLSSGKIFLSDPVFNNTKFQDTFNIVYTKDGKQQPEVTINVIEKDIPDKTLERNQKELETYAIRAVAALYKIFWEITHTPASVSSLNILTSPVVLGQPFTVFFTLKELNGAAKHYDQIAVKILKSDDSFVFDAAVLDNVDIAAHGTYSQFVSNTLYTTNSPGTYKVELQGKIGDQWFPFNSLGFAQNPITFQVAEYVPSSKFQAAFESFGGASVLGDSNPYNPSVHKWGNIWVQDFLGTSPDWDKSILIYNEILDTIFCVHGKIWAHYENIGVDPKRGVNSWLGLPTSNEYEVSGGARQNFQNGYLIYLSDIDQVMEFPNGAPTNTPTIGQTPLQGTAGDVTFSQYGSGFTPNGTVTLHFKPYNPSRAEDTLTVSLNAAGSFNVSYAPPTSKPAGIYQWWAEDNTGRRSDYDYYTVSSPGTSQCGTIKVTRPNTADLIWRHNTTETIYWEDEDPNNIVGKNITIYNAYGFSDR